MALLVKNPPANAEDSRDVCLISGLGRSPGQGNGNPLVFLPEKFHGERSLEGLTRVEHDLATKHTHTEHVCVYMCMYISVGLCVCVCKLFALL